MGSDSEPADDRSLEGLAITPAEVEKLLRGRKESAAQEATFYQKDPEARRLSARIAAAEAELAQHPLFSRLRREFALSRFEIDLLALAAAVEIDPPLRRVYAYLHDDAAAAYASPWLVSLLFPENPFVQPDPQSPLVQWRLARPAEDAASPWAANAPWTADAHIVFWLLGRNGPDPVVESAAELLPKAASLGKPCLYPAEARPDPGLCGIGSRPSGGDRTGRRGRRWKAHSGRPGCRRSRFRPPCDRCGSPPAAGPAGGRRRRKDYSRGAHGPPGGNDSLLAGWRANQPASVAGDGRPFRRHAVRRAGRQRRRGSLTRCPDVGRASAVIACGASRIVDAAHAAPAGPAGDRRGECDCCRNRRGRPGHAPGGPEAVARWFQDSRRISPEGLFTALPCHFTWDDIVLHHALREHLRELEQQVRLRPAVYDEWGFERLCPLGRGITALFAGPSGTGKTMAAQVLAHSLDLQLLRVDLSGVVNKYIGETEKRLKQVFDACERSSVLLFFDEADALFGQRTQVKDAHDRFANIEIDYLLQRMEQFDGVAILATNRKGDLDKAFVRRIRFILDFLPPGPAERMAIWRRALEPRAPGGEEILDQIDWGFLAHKLTMTGADITAAALNAAFLARSRQSRITMDHILHAVRREMTKHGVVVRLGEWGG